MVKNVLNNEENNRKYLLDVQLSLCSMSSLSLRITASLRAFSSR